METEPSLEKKNIEVIKMHVLVHPGYGYGDDRADNLSRNLPEAESLFNKYKAIASSLPVNEIMVILIHNKPEKFKADLGEKKTYIRNLLEIKKLFSSSRQAIFLTSETAPFSGAEKEADLEALEKIKSTAKSRGYEISGTTQVEIFGENHNECVSEVFNGIQNTGFFENVHTKKLK